MGAALRSQAGLAYSLRVNGFILAGALTGLVLGLMLLVRGFLDRSRVASSLAALVLIAAAAIALIAASPGVSAVLSDRLEILELALISASGPLAVLIAAGLLRQPLRKQKQRLELPRRASLPCFCLRSFMAGILSDWRFRSSQPLFYSVGL